MKNFLETMKTRRSIYHLGKSHVDVNGKVKPLLEQAILHTPSPYNMQSQRAVLLSGAESDAFWQITEDALAKVVEPDKFGPTKEKIAAFAAGDGTILFFEDTAATKSLMDAFPLYAHNFPPWAVQAGAMLQFAVWNLLAANDLGASLQHYNPLVDEAVQKRWNLPASWKLEAQMPFGKILSPAGEKEFQALDHRLLSF